MTQYGLILAFDTDSPEFARGMELGMVWSQLQLTDERSFMMHQTNAEHALRMAESLDLHARCELLDEPWMLVHFEDPA